LHLPNATEPQSPNHGEIVLFIKTDNPNLKIKILKLLEGKTHLFKLSYYDKINGKL